MNFLEEQSIPKYEFHCHLNGSLGCICTEKYLLESVKNELLNNKLTSNTFFKNLQHFNKIIIDKFDILEEIIEEMIISYIENNCIYLEIRDTPRISNSLSIETYFNKIYQVFSNLQKKYKDIIILQFIISLHRGSHFFEKILEIVEYLKKMPNKFREFISCIDFSGDQKSQTKPFSDYMTIFNDLKDNGFKLTFHCFEYETDDNFNQILTLNPTRISQCFYLNDKDQLDELIKSKIPLEICPTSAEIFTQKEFEKFDNYKYLIKNNHPIIIGSDSTNLMKTNIKKEYEKFKLLFDNNKSMIKNYLNDQNKYTLNTNAFKIN